MARFRFLVFSIANGYGTLEELLFMKIWNSHGQLKWLKAHLIREDNQSLLEVGESIERIAARENDDDLNWLAQFVKQHEDEGSKYPNPFFGGSNPLHVGKILEKIKKRTLIFGQD